MKFEREGGHITMIGKSIKQYLSSKGITQTFISEKSGISITTLNAILNGNRGLLAEEYFTICEVLEVPLDTFAKKST